MSSKKHYTYHGLKDAISQLCTEIRMAILRDYNNDCELQTCLLGSYNYYQESERDGVDYIFDITDKEDLNPIDLGVGDIVYLYNNYKAGKTTQYFLYGVNYEEPKQFENEKDVDTQILSYLDEIIEHVLMYPEDCASHTKIYAKYFARFIREKI